MIISCSRNVLLWFKKNKKDDTTLIVTRRFESTQRQKSDKVTSFFFVRRRFSRRRTLLPISFSGSLLIMGKKKQPKKPSHKKPRKKSPSKQSPPPSHEAPRDLDLKETSSPVAAGSSEPCLPNHLRRKLIWPVSNPQICFSRWLP